MSAHLYQVTDFSPQGNAQRQWFAQGLYALPGCDGVKVEVQTGEVLLHVAALNGYLALPFSGLNYLGQHISVPAIRMDAQQHIQAALLQVSSDTPTGAQHG